MKKMKTNKEDVIIEETETYLDDLYLMVAANLFKAQSKGDIRPFEATQRTLRAMIEGKEQEDILSESWSLVA